MRYYRQENSSKHVAINLGTNVADGGWSLILDSDDWLPERGLEVSARYIKQIEDDNRFAGVVGLRGTDEEHLLWIHGTSPDDLTARGRRALEREYIDATSKEYRYKLKIPGGSCRDCEDIPHARTPLSQLRWGTVHERGTALAGSLRRG